MPKPMPPDFAATAPIDAGPVLDWYDRHARKLPWRIGPAERHAGVRADPYRVWLSEIMLQQTTIAAVGRFYARFTALWPTVEKLAGAPLEAILVEWAGLGYYARARNLHACARVVARDHAGQFPATAATLLSLPGIGSYTAAAIAAICFDEPIAVLDGNVERVLARYLALDRPVREAKEALRGYLQQAVPRRAGDFGQALMDLGSTICAPRAALCLACPLSSGCKGRASGVPLAYPVKASKPERPTRYGHAFVIQNGRGEVLLRSRQDKGLLAKMTEVPGSEWGSRIDEASFPFGGDWRRAGEVVHVFTHFRLILSVWSGAAPAGFGTTDGWWTDPAEFDAEALPSLFRKVLAIALG